MMSIGFVNLLNMIIFDRLIANQLEKKDSDKLRRKNKDTIKMLKSQG